MNALDVLLIVVAACLAVGGFRLGFAARATSWIGIGGGVLVGLWLAPAVVDRFPSAGDTTVLIVGATVVALCGFAGQMLGYLAGARFQIAVPAGTAHRVDQVAGAIASAMVVVVAVWLLSPATADIAHVPAAATRGSTIVDVVHRTLPHPPAVADRLRQILGDPSPSLFSPFAAGPDTGPPPRVPGLSPTMTDRAARSVVQLRSEACGALRGGTGFVVDGGLVVTAAHVVAGQAHPQVSSDGRTVHTGRVVAFDPERDVAVVRVPGLARRPLALTSGRSGGSGAVFGHPDGGPLRLSPYRIWSLVSAGGSDIYDHSSPPRQILVLAAKLHRGDSGGPLIDAGGAVAGMAISVANDRSGVAYALSVPEVRAVIDTAGARTVDAGACIR